MTRSTRLIEHQADAMAWIESKGVKIDLTRAKFMGVPANYRTAVRYPCHDRDLMRDLVMEALRRA